MFADYGIVELLLSPASPTAGRSSESPCTTGACARSATAADGRHVPLSASIIDHLAGLREAQVRQREPLCFDVVLVPGPGYDVTLEAHVHHAVDELFGPGQVVRIELVDRVPRTAAGKLKAAVVVNDLVDQP